MNTESDRCAENIALIKKVVVDVFTNLNADAVEQYFAEDYQQHNPDVGDGRKGLLEALPNFPKCHLEYGHIIAQGDMVVTHSRVTGWFPKPVIVFDMFRIANGKIAEHWDVVQEEVPTKSGRGMFAPRE
jgi:predicted SnoaL-like aldol condensation-catalyzing enzyme